MKKNKIILITILYTISFIFIVLAGFNFYYHIPRVDEKIQSKEEGLSRALENHLLHQIFRQTISIIDNQSNILKEMNSNSDKLNEIYNEGISKRLLMLIYTHTYLKGYPPDETTKSYWESLNQKQLNEEYKSLEGDYIVKTQESINELKDKKRNILLFYTILQIFGLFITQVAIILTLIFKKE